jgi:hypothetical protein
MICLWTVGGLLGLLPLIWAPAVIGQAPPPPAPASGMEVGSLRERAAAFWAARVAADFSAQWELLEPRGRGRMTAPEYASQKGAVKYLAYQVEDATVDGYFAVVKVRLLVQPKPQVQSTRRSIGPQAITVPDRWVRIAGTWYRSLEQVGEPGAETGER